MNPRAIQPVTVFAFLLFLAVQTACAYYDPGVQRWINRDPDQEWGGKNLYQFNFNNAVARIDLDGRGSIVAPPSQVILVELDIEVLAQEMGMTVQQLRARQAACVALHAAYSALDCKKCTIWTSKAEAAKQAACWSAKVGLRAAYGRAKCDCVLPGSLGRPAGEAAKGHSVETRKAIENMIECASRASQ